jgi:cytochrome c5
MKGILRTGFLLALASAGMAQAADQAIVDRYNKSCTVCHAVGVAGAPKTGDAAQWAPRMEKGMDALLQSVDKGMNAMPPKGMCYDCSAEDVQALIEYMAEAK